MSDRILLVFQSGGGLPSVSPFSTKAMILMEMAGLDYEMRVGNPTKGPKKKLPVLIDGSETIADSGFIRRHLEARYGVDFDEGLSDVERSQAVAFSALAEDRLYFAGLAERWLYPENREGLRAMIREIVPTLIAAPLTAMIVRSTRKDLHGQGHGRHTREEGLAIGKEAIDAFAAQLEQKPFLMGDDPSGVDASVYPMLTGNLSTSFTSKLSAFVEAHPNLMAYAKRMQERFPLKGMAAT